MEGRKESDTFGKGTSVRDVHVFLWMVEKIGTFVEGASRIARESRQMATVFCVCSKKFISCFDIA